MKTEQYPDCFYTDSYAAYRWDQHLFGKPGCWYLVSSGLEYDLMRGLDLVHVSATVDDFGNLVKVSMQ